MNLERGQVKRFTSLHGIFTLKNSDLTSIILILMSEFFINVELKRRHVRLHHFTHSDFISNVVKHIWEFFVGNCVIFLKSDQKVFFFWSQKFGTSDDVLKMLKRYNTILDSIDFFKEITKKLICLLDLIPVHHFQGIWIWMFHFFCWLFDNISGIKSPDSIDTDWDELLPRDELVLILIGKGDKHVDIIVIKSIGKGSEGVSEFWVGQFSRSVLIHVVEHIFKGSLQSCNESWRVDVNFLRRSFLSFEILNFLDVKCWHKRIYDFTIKSNESSMFKFSSQMKFSLDFQFFLKNIIDPWLKL